MLEVQEEWIPLLITLDCKFGNTEKQEVLTWKNALLKQVKISTVNNIYTAKENVIDPTKWLG